MLIHKTLLSEWALGNPFYSQHRYIYVSPSPLNQRAVIPSVNRNHNQYTLRICENDQRFGVCRPSGLPPNQDYTIDDDGNSTWSCKSRKNQTAAPWLRGKFQWAADSVEHTTETRSRSQSFVFFFFLVTFSLLVLEMVCSLRKYFAICFWSALIRKLVLFS